MGQSDHGSHSALPDAWPDVTRACAYALSRLERELSPTLCYHSVAHTRDDVAVAVKRLASAEKVVGEALLLLRTAAYFHDVGFVEAREDHEFRGARIAAAALPGFGYRPDQIALIEGMIMATRLPQMPRTLLERILADADLDVFGRADFLAVNSCLRAELAAAGSVFSDSEWYSGQISFLCSHRYWTSGARALRDQQKRANIAALERLLSASAEHD
ncbi:MAG TPA: HD domain-containing protein [Roseiflexaceae bacterium]|nr:HD domain-containing protein [Roseiflexaceae bacterium]